MFVSVRGLLNQVRQPNLFFCCSTPAQPAYVGACPHPARPHHPVYWGVSTHCAPTPPRALGCVHTLRAYTTPRIGVCPHLRAPPPLPRALGCVHTLRAQPPRVCGSVLTLCAPSHPVYWGVFTPFAPTPTRVCGSVLTSCAPTPPRALEHSHPAHPHHLVHWGILCAPRQPRASGRVRTLPAHATRALGVHPARPPPRALGHTLCAQTTPLIGGIHTLRTHIIPCIGARTSSYAPSAPPLCRADPHPRDMKKHTPLLDLCGGGALYSKQQKRRRYVTDFIDYSARLYD